jgi:nicotinamidase-related amidase
MKALIVVDMQNDFIDGSLANPAAQAIVDPIIKKIKEFDGRVIFTQDTHYSNYCKTQECKKLPIEHCKIGTPGWEIHSDILQAVTGRNFVHMIRKETFGYINWRDIIRDCEEIIICGTCTDICVVSNALIIKAMYPETKITVLKDLCAGLTPEKHEAALEVMRSCQIDVE